MITVKMGTGQINQIRGVLEIYLGLFAKITFCYCNLRLHCTCVPYTVVLTLKRSLAGSLD